MDLGAVPPDTRVRVLAPGRERRLAVMTVVASFIAVAAVVIPAMTESPKVISTDQTDGRTWLALERAGVPALVLANGISGLVEAEAEFADTPPSGMRSVGSTARFTLLRSNSEAVVVVDSSHVARTFDVSPTDQVLLSRAGLVTVGDSVVVHSLNDDGSVEPAQIVVDAGGPVPGASAAVDANGSTWMLRRDGTSIVALQLDTDATVERRVPVDSTTSSLGVYDGTVIVRTASGIAALGGELRRAVLPTARVPAIAEASQGVWADADSGSVRIVRPGRTPETWQFDAPVREIAIWHGAVWVATDDGVSRVDARGISTLAGISSRPRVFADGGRLWFFADGVAAAVDNSNRSTVFQLRSVDLSLCVGDCSAGDAAQFVEEQQSTSTAPDASRGGTSPTTVAVPATTEPPLTITLPPVVPTSPRTVAPSTTVPDVAPTDPGSTAPTSTDPSATEPQDTEPQDTEPLAASSTTPPIDTVPGATAPIDSGGAPTSGAVLGTEPANTSPDLTQPQVTVIVPDTAEPTSPRTRPAPTTTEPTDPDPTDPPRTTTTTEPAPTTDASSTTQPPPDPGNVILGFVSGADPLPSGTTQVVVGFDGDERSCRSTGGDVRSNATNLTLEWAGAGSGFRVVSLNLGGEDDATETVSIGLTPGLAVVTATVCGLSASITRGVLDDAPEITPIELSSEPGIGGSANASVSFHLTPGWSVGSATWQFGPCGETVEAAAAQISTSDSRSTLRFTVGGAGTYCIGAVVAFVVEAGGRTVRDAARDLVVGTGPLPPSTADPTTTTSDPTTTTSEADTTTPATTATTEPAATEPPTTPAATEPTTTEPTTTVPETSDPAATTEPSTSQALVPEQ